MIRHQVEAVQRRVTATSTWVYLLYMFLYLPEREKIAHI
jgi:hypothetical protein